MVGNTMHKLSQHVRGCFNMKRRRDSNSSNSSNGEQRSSSEMTIVHVSMEESRRNTRMLKQTNAVPMNYWMQSDDESDTDGAYSPNVPNKELGRAYSPNVPNKELGRAYSPNVPNKGLGSVYSPNVLSRESSFVDVLSDRSDAESDNDAVSYASDMHFMPLRSVPAPKTGRAKATNSAPVQQGRKFSRDEWEKRANQAVFGTRRSHADEASISSNDWDAQTSPAPYKAERTLTTSSQGPYPKPMTKQKSGISVRAGQIPNKLCSNALNELLFSTNEQIDGDLHDMMEDYINGRGIGNLTDDFDAIVDHAYSGFITAARAILDITKDTQTEQTNAKAPDMRRYPSSKYAGSMESLLSEIVDCYTNQTEDSGNSYAHGSWRSSHMRTSPRQSLQAEQQMDSYGIDVIKYNKEQLRRYAVTSLSKYVESQVLFSTGIENDLADKLDEAAESLRMITQQIHTLESCGTRVEANEMGALRKRAIRYRRTVKQLKADAKDASSVRRIFEMALLEVQML
ncbi:hypothetical protein LPJ77_000959 [Coemansia sp. RSA 2523]|nr:hypothetical protein LPJ54_000454 [Coemansia sp. RSA 1824]KAJ1810377.1 hypothetical protein LPJ77_000959 [Coemansia sp. RSA 2523]KAJ2527258.1 hypothetical protein IWW43_005996 [Coemansia sp. RSA 1935]